jgi:hypothetical protein
MSKRENKDFLREIETIKDNTHQLRLHQFWYWYRVIKARKIYGVRL